MKHSFLFIILLIIGGLSSCGSDEGGETTEPTCNAITSINLSQTDNQISLSWTKPAGVNSTEIRYGSSGFSLNAGTLITSSGTSASISADSFDVGQYQVYLRSVCGNNLYSSWQGPFSFTIENNCPSVVPSDFVMISEYPAEAFIYFEGDVEYDGATSFTLEYGEQGFTLGEGEQVSFSTTPFELPLSPEITYDFYVTTQCSSEESDTVGPFVFTTDPCGVISNLNTHQENEDGVQIWWDSTSSITSPRRRGFEVEYGPAGFTIEEGNREFALNNEHFIEYLNLESFTEYDIYVREVCGDSYTEWTGPTTIRTPADCNQDLHGYWFSSTNAAVNGSDVFNVNGLVAGVEVTLIGCEGDDGEYSKYLINDITGGVYQVYYNTSANPGVFLVNNNTNQISIVDSESPDNLNSGDSFFGNGNYFPDDNAFVLNWENEVGVFGVSLFTPQ